jgi:RNA polymerase sigma factor (sigma-70 family)
MRISDVNIMSAPGSAQTSATGIEEAADFQSVRPRLFGIAYQMLGRVADAEDVVQDVWIRWQRTDRARVNDRVAFLVKITTHVAINLAVSARVRREIAVGGDLPEQGATAEDPALAAEQLEDLEYAVRLLLERLSPTERAVFVLREAFGYRFREIAETLAISNANARQLGRRARAHLAERRHEPVQPTESDRLLRAFLDAAQDGDVADLERLLVDDVISHSARNVRTRPAPLVACGV